MKNELKMDGRVSLESLHEKQGANMKYVIIGGVAAGASAAARLRRLDEQAEIVLLEKGSDISYANCGLPYHVGGVIAVRDEGGNGECLTRPDIHFGKKESVKDTARVLGRIYDGILFRGFKQSDCEALAKYSGVPVWNGLTDDYHPTQIFADLLTVRETFGSLEGVTVAYVGDGRNNVANSLMMGCAKCRVNYVCCCPKELEPDPAVLAEAKEVADRNGVTIKVFNDPKEGVKGANVLYTDVWVSMGEEAKTAERIKMLRPYQINMDLMHATGNIDGKLMFLHCLPAFHDLETEVTKDCGALEVTDEVFESKYSKVFEESENRMHTIKALLVSALCDRKGVKGGHRTMTCKFAFLGALVAAAGCVSVAVDGGAVATPEKKGLAQPLAKVKIDSARNTKYGVWVGKGPRILDADGNPLLDAQVHFRDDPELFRFGLDEDARVVVNRYLDTYNHSANVNVICPGYRSRRDVPIFQGEKLVDEIRLEKAADQPPCREFNVATDVFGNSKERVYGFDLVEGDWMPPRGWGKTEDIRVHLAADPSALPSETSSRFSISSSGIKPRRSGGSNWEEFVKIEFLGKDDGYGYDRRAFADSTNRVLTATAYGSLPNVGYRVRGYYGELTGFSMRKMHDYDAERAKATPRKPGLLDCLHVEISGRVNREPGLKALVPASAAVVPRSPTSHPVPGDGNALAFGLSADERAAVCFGWTQDGAKVPEIFEKGVYTANPATALPRLVTLYFDPSYRGGTHSPMINGLPELRTVVNVCEVYGQGIGESAFANNPKLNAVVFTDGYEMTVAGNAFSGCATNVTAVFVEGGREFPRAWQTITVSNVFARMCKVVTGGRQRRDTLARPEIDTRFGIVELPVLTMDEDRLEKEYSDGRIIRYFKDGTVEKLRK